MFRKVNTERAILVLLLRDDDPLDQITPIAKLGPATLYICIRLIQSVNDTIANLLADNQAFPLVCWQAYAKSKSIRY